MSGKIDVPCEGSRRAGILDTIAGKPAGRFVAWINNIIAEVAPRGAIGDNIYVVNADCLTINILSKVRQKPI